MRNKLFIFSIIFFVITNSCNHQKKFIIKGELKNFTKSYVYLAEMNLTDSKIIDSVKTNRDGTFKFKGYTDVPSFYQITFNKINPIILLIEPGQKISLKADVKNTNGNYTIFGSEGSEQVKLLNNHLHLTRLKLDSIENIININRNKPGFDSTFARLNHEYIKTIADQRKFSIKFILEHLKSLSGIIALYQKINDSALVLNKNRDIQYYNLLSDTLLKYYPKSKPVQMLFENKVKLNEAYNVLKIKLQKDKAKAVSFPDIALQDINGDTVHLSRIKGKCILINFWEPLNDDCNSAMQGIKKLYSVYRKKGFEIFNIGLVENRTEWYNYVKANQLPGINVIDKKIDESYYARLYNVNALPASYLIGPDNIIAGKDLFGENLRNKLQKLLR